MFKTSELEELFKENYDALCMFSMHYVEGFEAARTLSWTAFRSCMRRCLPEKR